MAEFLDPRRTNLLMERITRGGSETSSFRPAAASSSTQRHASRSPPPPPRPPSQPAPVPSQSQPPPTPMPTPSPSTLLPTPTDPPAATAPSNGPPPPSVLLNDGSNLSSAGSVSDGPTPDTPEKATPSSVTAVVNSVAAATFGSNLPPASQPAAPAATPAGPAAALPSTASAASPAPAAVPATARASVSGSTGSEKKRRGKRSRPTASDSGESVDLSSHPKTPKSEKKMDEWIVRNPGPSNSNKGKTAKSMGFGVGLGSSLGPNSSLSDTTFVPISPERSSGNSRDGTETRESGKDDERSRGTPTLCPYPASDNSASGSGQSPPGAGVPGWNGARLYGHCQTTLTGEALTKTELERDEALSKSEELNLENEQLAADVEALRRALTDAEEALASRNRQLEDQEHSVRRSKDMMCHLLTEQSIMARKQRRTRCMEDRLRLGQYTTERTMHQFQEKWQDGYAFEEQQKKQAIIKEEREEIEAATKLLRKSRKPSANAAARDRQRAASQQASGVSQLSEPVSPGPMPSSSGLGSTASPLDRDEAGFLRPDVPRDLNPHDYYERDEIYRLRREQLKKEEADCSSELARLERERQLHIREIKRIQNEDASKHKDHNVLHKRYLLLSLLGKGGFSEVWKSFDLDENRYVACKIHHVNREWKEEKKANYVKHALREKDIHKTLVHPRIVSLYDVFTIDNHSFCTVLEYCDGNDLDFYLKQNKTIPEKEARSIIMQVINALKYLGDLNPSVIHYDLKPANILLSSGTSSGEIKITDFGLSKLLEQQDADSPDEIELTSQGAGTYWYLPPECFVIGPPGGQQKRPTINQKVDVWSVGVIFYQCLYGKRPFGDGQTQEGIMKEQTILKATEPDFPTKPSVSQEAKNFIKCCLQYRKEDRADVNQLYANEYLRPRSLRASGSQPRLSTSSDAPTSSTRSDSGAVSPGPTPSA